MTTNNAPQGDWSELALAGESPLTQQEERALQAALWSLLQKRVLYATMGDSSSIRVERAEALYESLCDTLKLHLQRNGLPLRTLLRNDPNEVYDAALQTVENMLANARTLYLRASAYEPPVPNISYRDTLRELDAFFARYDYRQLERDVPCDIDYQLCLPVPETLGGVSYVSEYLRRFLVEAETVARFDIPSVKRLLDRAYGDPVDLLVNLYEPVMTNAVGAALCGLRARALDVPASSAREPARELAGRELPQIKQQLAQAAQSALDELKIDDKAMRRYFCEACGDIAPRLKAALDAGDTRHVFVPLYD